MSAARRLAWAIVASLALAAGGQALAQAPAAPLRIFVSPNGNDAWRGDRPAPAADGKAGPVATLEAARDLARAQGGVKEIVLREGDYYLERTVVFDGRDNGLSLVAAPGEHPVLHGGPRVSGWREDENGVWSAPLVPAEGARVGDLLVAGERQTEARFPDQAPQDDGRTGWLFAAKPEPNAEWLGNGRFRFHPGDLPPIGGIDGLVAHIVGGAVPGMQWGSDTLPVTAIDRASRTIETRGSPYFYMGEGSRYILAGRPEFLNAPGEWWFDEEAKRIRHKPSAAHVADATIVAGILPTILHFKGTVGVTLSGLRFADGAPDGSGKFGTDTRGGGAVRLERADRARLVGNVFRNVGVAIHVAESDDVAITGNDIAHTAGNAIYLGTTWGTFRPSNRAEISHNRIFDVGTVYFESAAIWFQAASDIRIAHNRIERTAQFGIAGGSIWGSDDACYRSLIEYNTVHAANQRTGDGGAIKLMGMQGDRQDSIIRSNLVTGTDQLMNRPDGRFWPPRYENTEEWPTPISWAIYLDGRASGVAITGNLLRGNVAGIGINGGWSNRVSGNVVAEGTGSAFRFDDASGRDWRPAWAEANLVERNVVLADPGAARVVDIHAPNLGSAFVAFSDNLYWGALGAESFRTVPPPNAPGGTGDLARFIAEGWATGDRIADPGFANPAEGDYRLEETSPAARLGIDMEPLRRAGQSPSSMPEEP